MKRYYVVASERSTRLHIKREDNRSEGLTRCGRFISVAWHWYLGGNKPKLPRCKGCYT